jgi:hypothetical protein
MLPSSPLNTNMHRCCSTCSAWTTALPRRAS